ncbi:MAG: hypothetical protein AAB035_05490 [Nitrospirota bacterium]
MNTADDPQEVYEKVLNYLEADIKKIMLERQKEAVQLGKWNIIVNVLGRFLGNLPSKEGDPDRKKNQRDLLKYIVQLPHITRTTEEEADWSKKIREEWKQPQASQFLINLYALEKDKENLPKELYKAVLEKKEK